MSDSKEILTLKEAAKLLRVSDRALWGYVQSNEIPFFKVGAQYRFSRHELDAWISQQSETSKEVAE